MNTLSSFYLIPYFDMGVALEADGTGGVSYIGAQVDYLIPGRSSLMSRSIAKQADIDAELKKLFDPAGYEQLRKEQYIKNIQVDRPAVLSVNGAIAYHAVLSLLDRLVGYRIEPSYGNVTMLLHTDGNILQPENSFARDEYLAKYKGRGDCKPYLNMSYLS